MFGNLTLLIGAYIILRCVDIFCRDSELFASPGARGFAILGAAVVILVTGLTVIDTLIGGSELRPRLSSASSYERPKKLTGYPELQYPSEEELGRQTKRMLADVPLPAGTAAH